MSITTTFAGHGNKRITLITTLCFPQKNNSPTNPLQGVQTELAKKEK